MTDTVTTARSGVSTEIRSMRSLATTRIASAMPVNAAMPTSSQVVCTLTANPIVKSTMPRPFMHSL